MSTRVRTRRLERCPTCALPCPLCLCADLPRLEVRTRVVVRMHRAESGKSSNSARLAVRVLAGARLDVIGARNGVETPFPAGRIVVLFPLEGARVLTPDDGAGERTVLVVPDGTWSQARKVMQRAVSASGADVVQLPEGPPTRYGLRRRAREGTVSTYEAIARALSVLEGESIAETMLPWFDAFVARTKALRGWRDQATSVDVASNR